MTKRPRRNYANVQGEGGAGSLKGEQTLIELSCGDHGLEESNGPVLALVQYAGQRILVRQFAKGFVTTSIEPEVL